MTKILINKDIISTLNPCKDMFDNYVKYYGDKSFTKQQFMGLKHISHYDKVWVATKLISTDPTRYAAACNDCTAAAYDSWSRYHALKDPLEYDKLVRKILMKYWR